MPTYQYACKDCGNHFEQVQSFSDPSLTTCPQCAGTLRKVYGSVGVVFKGSGFYRTDSRSGASSSSISAGGKSDDSGSSGASTSGSSESSAPAVKPAAGATSSPAAKVAASSGGSSGAAKAAS